MAKNIVICCDGTDNKLTVNTNTNIIYLYQCLKHSPNQVSYYNPGVGTITPSGFKSYLARKWYTIKDLVSAASINDNVNDAYRYLMEVYEEGDKIYLFGFSRGAYTVRMLSSMIHMFGLLFPGNTNHIRYILEVYHKSNAKFILSHSFKQTFSRDVKIEFMGIFDTVVSVGGLLNPEQSIAYSRKLTNVNIVRHAISIDDRRKHYHRQTVDPQHPNLKEVHFAGVHSDIGGSFEKEGLSKIVLEWMLGEASNSGLILDKQKVQKVLYAKNPPDFRQKVNKNYWWWLLFELVPRNASKYIGNDQYISKLDFSFNSPRLIPVNAHLHSSVFSKLGLQGALIYNPSNINKDRSTYIEEKNSIIKTVN